MISISQQGTQVMSGIYEIMHDPDYWKDPEVFRPGETKNLPFSMLQKEQIYIEHAWKNDFGQLFFIFRLFITIQYQDTLFSKLNAQDI